MVRWLAVASLSLGLLLVDAPHALAQDDWGLTRPSRRGGGARGRGRPSAGDRRGRRRGGRPGRGRTPNRGAGDRSSAGGGGAQAAGGQRTDVLIQRYLRILDNDPRETFAFQRLLDLYRERDGNIDGLVQELSQRVEADDEAYAPRMLLGHVYKAQNLLDRARAVYRRAAELRPDEAAPRVALAQVERTASNPEQARRLYDEALERTDERLAREELLREVAQLAMELRDFDGARGYYQELSRGGGGSVYLRSEYARALGSAGEWERAVAEYERVIRSLRGDNRVLPPILLELSRAQLQTGEAEASIETLERALRLAGRQAGIRAEIYDQLLLAHRRTDRLPELAERLRREAGRGFETNELLGRIEDELGNDEEALEAYRRAVRSRPRHIDTRVRIIQLLSRSGRLDDVIEEYRALIRSAPREPRFVIELAQLLVQTDQREDALQLVRNTGRRHPRDAALHQQLAELYARWGEDELAAQEIELLARIDPHDPAHVIALGAQQFDAGDREAAVRTWRRVIEVEGDRARGHATLAGILADHDMLPQAIEEYREAVRLDPDEISFVRGLATTLERQRDNEEAEQQWRRVLELAGDDRVARREARERIVGIWSRTRQLPARIRELTQRFEGDPPDTEAGRFLAEAYRRRGAEHAAQAERVLGRIVQVDPGDVETLLALERIRRHRGDLAGAIEVLARLRDADPRRAARYLQQMAEHALALYRDEEAVRYAAEAVQHNPDDASAHRRLADLYRARQDIERAVSSYRRALELNERLYPVYFELAELHLAGGETEEADRLYRRVLQITPDDDLVARAARASVQINLGAGSLGELERDLLPLALSNPQRPIFRRMVVELYDAYAGPLVLRARRGGPGGEEASQELRQIGTRAIKPLLEALADQDPSQRRVALDILGHLGNANAAAPLLAVAEDARHELTQRMAALLAAGSVAPAALVPRFVALAEGDDPRLHGLATWALARIGGREALRALERLFASDEAAVRAFAAIGLGQHERGGQRLTRALRSDSHVDVTYAAAWALGRAGDASDASTLIAALRTRGGEVARIAADSLGEVGGEEAEEALVSALFEPDAQLRTSAARALRRAAAEPVEPAALPPPEPFERVRDYVRRLVERRQQEPAPPPGAEALRRWEPMIEASASAALRGPVERMVAALAALGSRTGQLGVGALTADRDGWPEASTRALEGVLDRLASALVDELVTASEHLDAAVRMEAARLLVLVPGAEAEAAVASALSRPPASVQRAALEALASTDRPLGGGVTEQLAGLLRADRDWSMRTRAARALSGTTAEVGRTALREALESDAYAFVREAAASGLHRSEADEDVAALQEALRSDGEARVRAAALRALLARGGEVASRARRRAARDRSQVVRAAAAGAASLTSDASVD